MNEEKVSHIDPMLEYAYRALACTAIFAGIIACVAMVPGHWPIVFIFYLAATVARVGAGATMNRMGNAEVVNSWNAGHHRFVVIALNAGVGVVFLTATIWYKMWEAAFVTTLAFVIYLIAAKFTRPNTYGARLRSVFLTTYLVGVLANSAGLPYGLLILGVVLGITGASARLRALQQRFGWTDR